MALNQTPTATPRAAPSMLAKMSSLRESRDVASDQEAAGTTLTLSVDRNRASRCGIKPRTIDDTLDDAFGQRAIAQYFARV